MSYPMDVHARILDRVAKLLPSPLNIESPMLRGIVSSQSYAIAEELCLRDIATNAARARIETLEMHVRAAYVIATTALLAVVLLAFKVF